MFGKYGLLVSLLICTLTFLLFSGCSPGCAAPAGPGGDAPGEPLNEGQISFSVNPPDIQAGSCAEIAWNVPSRQVFGVFLNGQKVDNAGKKQVCPGATEAYSLDVDIGSAMLHKEVIVNVSAPGQQGQQPQQPGQGQQPSQPPQPPQPGAAKVINVVAYFPGGQQSATYTGPSFATHAFIADVTVDGPCTVTYQWERSDGSSGLAQTLVFNTAGAQQISTTWTFGGGPGTGTVWQRVNVLSPTPMTSNKAVLTVNFTS